MKSAVSSIGANSAASFSQGKINQSRTLVEKAFSEQGYNGDPEFAKPVCFQLLWAWSPTKNIAHADFSIKNEHDKVYDRAKQLMYNFNVEVIMPATARYNSRPASGETKLTPSIISTTKTMRFF